MRTLESATRLLVSCTIVAAVFAGGCLPPPMEMKPYQSLHSAAATPPSARWLAARGVLHSQGFTITAIDMASMSIVAIRETEPGSLRDRARVRVGSADTEIEFRTEMFDAGAWTHTDWSCVGYHHAREHALANELELVATNDPVGGRVAVAERATNAGEGEPSGR